MKFRRRKKLKKFFVYFITDGSLETGEYNNVFGIVRNEDEVRECIYRNERIAHSTHYEGWCRLRKLDPELEESFNQYWETVILEDGSLDKYIVTERYFTEEDLMSFIRLGNYVVPLGAKYETEWEEPAFAEMLNLNIELDKARED